MELPWKYGIVSEVMVGYAKVYFEEDDIVTDWWPVIMKTSLKDKENSPLNVQEHVVCLCDSRLEEGVIIGAIFNSQDTPDPSAGPGKFRQLFDDGTFIEYDKTAHKLTANVQGEIDVTALTTAKVTAPVVEIDGNVTVNGVITAGGLSLAAVPGVAGADGKVHGDLEATGTLSADTDVKTGTTSLKTHVHIGVQPGSGVSGIPQ